MRLKNSERRSGPLNSEFHQTISHTPVLTAPQQVGHIVFHVCQPGGGLTPVAYLNIGSVPRSGYNLPAVTPFPMPQDPNSQPPPMESTRIRFPDTPLNDIATLDTPPSRKKSPYFQPPASYPPVPLRRCTRGLWFLLEMSNLNDPQGALTSLRSQGCNWCQGPTLARQAS